MIRSWSGAFLCYVTWALAGWRWIVPPAIGFLGFSLYSPDAPSDGRRFHTTGTMLSIWAAAVAWLALARWLRQPALLYPFTLVFATHVAIFSLSRTAHSQPTRPLQGLAVGAVLRSWMMLMLPFLATTALTARGAVLVLWGGVAVVVGVVLFALGRAGDSRCPADPCALGAPDPLCLRRLTRRLAWDDWLGSLEVMPMPHVIELSHNDAMPQVTGTPLVPPVVDELRAHRPDRHLMLLDDREMLLARASCWWTSAPALPEHRVGLIGHYAANDDSSGLSILREALNLLEFAGCTIAVGPMDGNTWRRYRFVSERGSEPPFFLEPDNPDAWREQFERVGFRVMATYTSAVTGDLTKEDPRLDTTLAKLQSEGVTIRSFDPENADTELKQLFRLSLDSFQANYLYSPIDEDEFLDQNRRVLSFVVPDLVLMAERDSRLVGFLFAIPDILQRQRRDAIDTLIIKTVAVSPSMASHGLGGLLVGLVQRRARGLGFRRAIHALMHEQNVSRHISRRYAHTIRRYALYVRRFPRAIPG